eukprot:gene224-3991_t
MVAEAQNPRFEDWGAPMSLLPFVHPSGAYLPQETALVKPKSTADLKGDNSRSPGEQSPNQSASPGLSEPSDEDTKNVDCSFFVRTGTCAYGRKCKFNHPDNAAPPMLNIRGYPLRHGEAPCPHYVKRGWCAFGLSCKFNHPTDNPASEQMSDMKQMLESSSITSLPHHCDSDFLSHPASTSSVLGSCSARESLQGGLSALLSAPVPFQEMQYNDYSCLSTSSLQPGGCPPQPQSTTNICSSAATNTLSGQTSMNSVYGSSLTHGLNLAQLQGAGSFPNNSAGTSLYATNNMLDSGRNPSYMNLLAAESSLNSTDTYLLNSSLYGSSYKGTSLTSRDTSMHGSSQYGSSAGQSLMNANSGFTPGSLNGQGMSLHTSRDLLKPGGGLMDNVGSYNNPGAMPPRLNRHSAPAQQQLQQLQALQQQSSGSPMALLPGSYAIGNSQAALHVNAFVLHCYK